MGDTDNTVSVWQINIGYQESQFKSVALLNLGQAVLAQGAHRRPNLPLEMDNPCKAEVQTVRFLHDYAAFVATDSGGNIFVYNVQPAPHPYSLLALWQVASATVL